MKAWVFPDVSAPGDRAGRPACCYVPGTVTRTSPVFPFSLTTARSGNCMAEEPEQKRNTLCCRWVRGKVSSQGPECLPNGYEDSILEESPSLSTCGSAHPLRRWQNLRGKRGHHQCRVVNTKAAGHRPSWKPKTTAVEAPRSITLGFLGQWIASLAHSQTTCRE